MTQPKDALTGKPIASLMENFRKYPFEQTAHFSTAFIGLTTAIAGGYFIDPALVAGMGLPALVCCRQFGEFAKRRDTIGHDFFWVVLGGTVATVGSAVACAIHAFTQAGVL